MPAHVYHHYVPRFYLKAWTKDHQITRFQWINNELEMRRVGIKRTAGLDHLYSLKHFPQDPQMIEREFMGRIIDDPASTVYKHLSESKAPLSEHQRTIWTRFLLSLRVRMPDVIERLRVDAENELRQNLMANPEEYEALRGPNSPANLYDFLEKLRPGFVADFGIRMLPDLLAYQPAFKQIYEMYWWTHSFYGASISLLTSDRPLIITPSVDDQSCVLALPLGPHTAFFATHTLEMASRVASKPASKLAKAINHETVRLASHCVYSIDSYQTYFIKRHFRNALAH